MLYHAIAMEQMMKGHRPLTHHINSITITTKMDRIWRWTMQCKW